MDEAPAKHGGDKGAQIVVWLTGRQVDQINAIRGQQSLVTAANDLFREFLDRKFPVGKNLAATVALQTSRQFLYPGSVSSDYPPIEELIPAIPIALPPKVGAPGDRAQTARFHMERAVFMIAQENAGWPWDAIAESWNYASVATARHMVDRYLMITQPDVAATHRQRQLGIMETLLDYGLNQVVSPPQKFDIKGMPLRNPDGSWALDEEQRTRSIDSVVKITARMAKIVGSDAADAVKIQSNIVDLDNKIREMVERVKTAAVQRVVQGELASGDGQEAGSEGDEASRLSPGGPGAESPQQEQEDGGDQADQPETAAGSPGHAGEDAPGDSA